MSSAARSIPVIFTPAARAELIDAQDWYENEVPGLGRVVSAQRLIPWFSA